MTTNIAELVKQAERSTADVKDADLRKVAFDRVLQHLLEATGPRPSQRQEAKIPQSSDDAAPAAKGSSRAGPMAWLEELVGEGFFQAPKNQAEMLAELAARGHHLRDSDITSQLERLVVRRLLRRSKIANPRSRGPREIWGYSNW